MAPHRLGTLFGMPMLIIEMPMLIIVFSDFWPKNSIKSGDECPCVDAVDDRYIGA